MLAGVDEEINPIPAHVRVGVEVRDVDEPVHRHRDLARLNGVEGLLRLGVGVARQRAAALGRRLDERAAIFGLEGLL